MGIIELLGKIRNLVAQRRETTLKPKITNEEYELNMYKEKERQETIKKELVTYRRKDTKKMFEDTILREKPTMMSKDKALKGGKNVMTCENLFIK